jgi:hypothetical protein
MSSAASTAGSKVFFAVTDPTVLPRVTSPSVSVTATNSLCVSSATRRSSIGFGGCLFRRPFPLSPRRLLATAASEARSWRGGGSVANHLFGMGARGR